MDPAERHAHKFGLGSEFPKMVYGPKGEQHVVHKAGDPIPSGFKDHPRDHADSAPVKQAIAKGEAPVGGAAANALSTETSTAEGELDANGHAYDPELHPATRGLTTAGLWRMKPGKSRPAPAPGYPKPSFDL